MSEYIVRIPPDMPYEIRAELNAWYVESEPIVRCRDCKHYHEAGIASYTPFCEWMNDSDVTPDGFCAWGERKDGDAR